MDFRQIDKDLQKEFTLKKLRAEAKASSNILSVNKIPAYQKLDAIERELVLEVSKLKSQNKPYKDLQTELNHARSEKLNILKKLGLSKADLLPKYSCKLCNDTGFVNGSPCVCFQKRKNEELIKAFGLNTEGNTSLETYSTSICKNKSQAEALEKLAGILRKWKNAYPNIKKRNIVIYGQTGVGKTYITKCLANDLAKTGYSICYVSAFDLNNAFLKYHTTFDNDKNQWLAPFIDADFLFIDDLGTEPLLKNVTREYLYLILSERERFAKPVIVTTNLTLNSILDTYGERISSRLLNKITSYTISLNGSDLRTSK